MLPSELPADDQAPPGERPPHLLLTRSELRTLRKMANRYPIVQEERQEVLHIILSQARDPKVKPAVRVAACKTFIEMDKQNLQELEVFLKAKKASQDLNPEPEPAPQAVINNNNTVVNNVQMTLAEVLNEYGDILGISPGSVPERVGPGQPIHPPEADAEAGAVPDRPQS